MDVDKDVVQYSTSLNNPLIHCLTRGETTGLTVSGLRLMLCLTTTSCSLSFKVTMVVDNDVVRRFLVLLVQ